MEVGVLGVQWMKIDVLLKVGKPGLGVWQTPSISFYHLHLQMTQTSLRLSLLLSKIRE